MSFTIPAPAVLILESGQYIIRDNDTLTVERVWIDRYETCYMVDGTLIEQSYFHLKYTVLEHTTARENGNQPDLQNLE